MGWWSTAIEHVSASVHPAVLNAAINAAVNSKPVPTSVAEQSSLGAATFTQSVEVRAQHLRAHATHALAKQGISGEELAEWAQRNHPGEFTAAVRTHYESRQPTMAYAALVAKYNRGTMPSPEALAARGI
jgi:hypothetical protein